MNCGFTTTDYVIALVKWAIVVAVLYFIVQALR